MPLASSLWSFAWAQSAPAAAASCLDCGQPAAVVAASCVDDALRFWFNVCPWAPPRLVLSGNFPATPGRAVRAGCGATMETCFGRCDCAGILRIIAGHERRVTDMEIA